MATLARWILRLIGLYWIIVAVGFWGVMAVLGIMFLRHIAGDD